MKEAIQLLQYWQAYSEKAVEPNMVGFANWLIKVAKPDASENVEGLPSYVHSKNMSIGFLIGHLMAFAEIWTKLSFRNLPIQHFHDFGSLIFISECKNPTKKEIAQQSMLEPSSCFEALKRMTKNGLLEDFEDAQDKRVRRVILTDKGREVLGKAMHQASQLSDLLVGDLTEEEKRMLINVLIKLTTFHENLYESLEKEQIIEKFDL